MVKSKRVSISETLFSLEGLGLVGTSSLAEKIKVTKLTAPHPVTKQLNLNEDGSIQKLSTASQLHEGKISNLELSPSELVEEYINIGSNDCFIYGKPKDESAVRILSRKKYVAKDSPADATTRTVDEMVWSNGPAILMGDHDPNGKTRYLPNELREALYSICPPMGDVAQVWTASTSSCLINIETGVEIRGIEGQRLYVVVADGSDIPRAGQVLCKRAWLNGHGYIKISKAGSQLVRSILDEAVFQPNRIDYCAPPICIPPLASNKPKPVIYGDEKLALDTRVALPDLSKEEQTEYEGLVAKAKLDCKVEADATRAEYRKLLVTKYVATGMNQDDADIVVTKALDTKLLLADFVLIAESGQEVSVSELLANKEQWHGKQFYDPVEPDYHNDGRVAKAFLLGPRPFINSFAHGGQRYYLSHHNQVIRLVEGERFNYMNEITDAFALTGQFYCRSNQLVSIDELGHILPQSYYQVLATMDQQFRFEKFRGKDYNPINAPLELAKMFAEAYVSRFPKLKAVLTAPSIEPITGRILNGCGYDMATQVYMMVPSTVQVVPENPTSEEIIEALAMLWSPVKLFPYAESIDQTVMLTAMLTAVVRPLLSTAPGFAFDAPIQASGKTLLIKVVSALNGADPAISPQSDAKSDEEMRKRLFALLRSGNPSIVIDNIIGEFDSASLAAMLTTEIYTDRVLKESKTESAPTNAMVLLSGNNLIIKGDLPRRILRCRIDPKSETPHQREFSFDPVAVVQECRQELVVAALTLFKGYLAAKSDVRIGSGRMASFEVWDDLVRQTVCWLSSKQNEGWFSVDEGGDSVMFPILTDPMEAVNVAVLDDPARTVLGRLLNSWVLEIGSGNTRDTAVIMKTLISKATINHHNSAIPTSTASESQNLRDILGEMGGFSSTGDIRVLNLSKALSKYVDRITDGLCLRRGDKRQGSNTWWVEVISNKDGEVGGVGELVSNVSHESITKKSVRTKKKNLTNLTNLTKTPSIMDITKEMKRKQL